jgi:hypothetical protein
MKKITIAGIRAAFFSGGLPHAFLGFVLLLLAHGKLQGQGAWIPGNADLSFPRTLIKASEIPATQAWITRPEILPLYANVYQGAQANVNGPLNDNGSRRVASFIAKNAAFVLLLDRRPLNGTIDTLTASQRTAFKNKALSMLSLINSNVEAYPDFENYLWRSNELTNNLIAYDLLKGAGVPDSSLAFAKAKLQEYASNLHEQITFNFLNLGLFSLHVDNHSLRSCGAIGMAAVVLNDATSSSSNDRALSWINTSLFQIDNVMFRDAAQRQTTPGVLAGYAEGPHYLRFGMKHVLPFFHALGNFIPDTTLSITYGNSTRQIRHPWHDPNFDLLYEWIMRIRMPDGRFPALEDSFSDVAYPELAITEQPRFHAPIFFSHWESEQINSMIGQLHHSSDDVVADYIASRTEAAPDTFPHFLPMVESGDLLYRNGWDSTSTYMHFNARNGLLRTSAKGHNQADVSSFLMMAHGQMLALDPGYLKWDRRGEVAEASNHNMILVDGAGPSTGQTNNPGDADGFLEDAYDLARMDFAEVRTNYLGASITRRPLFVREDYFILGDDVSAQQSHTYRWQLHGYGLQGGGPETGTFAMDQGAFKAYWTKNGVNLQAVVLSDNPNAVFSSGTAVHELAYDTIQSHTALHVDAVGLSAKFIAVMIPFLTDTPMVTAICGQPCGSVKIERDGFLDIATVGNLVPAALSGLPADLVSDGSFAFLSHSSNMVWDQMALSSGHLLTLGLDTLIYSSGSNDIAYARLDSSNAEGFITSPGTVKFRQVEFIPGTVLGAGISMWSYDPTSRLISATFNGEGYFTVHEAVLVGSPDDYSADGLTVWPVPSINQMHVCVPGSAGMLIWSDLSGRILRKWEISGQDTILDLEGIPSGVGILRFHDSVSGKSSAKVITKQH